MGDCEPTEEREAQNIQVACGIKVHKLQVAEAHCSNNSKHAEKVGAYNRGGNGCEQSPHFGKASQEDHNESSKLNNATASNLVRKKAKEKLIRNKLSNKSYTVEILGLKHNIQIRRSSQMFFIRQIVVN